MRPRPDARGPFCGAAARRRYPSSLTRFLRAGILAHWAGAVIAETLAAQGRPASRRGLERSYGLGANAVDLVSHTRQRTFPLNRVKSYAVADHSGIPNDNRP
jgi:hypothetical protein